MRDAFAAVTCASAGCLVIVLPCNADLLIKAMRGHPKGTIIDTLLGERTGCMVVGSKDDCDRARTKLGIGKEAS